MAKKKLSFKAFEKCRISTSQKQNLKGGDKYVPQGVNGAGTNIIIVLADIRLTESPSDGLFLPMIP